MSGIANPFEEGWGWWALGLAVGLPLLLVITSEVLHELNRRGSAAAKPVRFLRNWVLPFAALFVLLAFALQSDAGNVWLRIVATILGTLVVLLVLSAFNVAMFRRKGMDTEASWQRRVPNIFVELARVFLVIIGVALLLQFVWGADVGAIWTGLGFGSIVLGLALQKAAGGIFSGLLLLFESPFKIGDSIEGGGASGRVIDINWRSVHVQTANGMQIVPNAALADGVILNKSRSGSIYNASVDVEFTTDDPPHEVIALLTDVASSLPMLAPNAHPRGAYHGGAAYSVSLPLETAADEARATSLFLAWLWYGARRRALGYNGDTTDPLQEPESRKRALETVESALQFTTEQREAVDAAATLERFGMGETIVRKGDMLEKVGFIVEGSVQMVLDTEEAGRIEVGDADAGEYIASTALARQPQLVTCLASGMTTIMWVPVEVLDGLINQRPATAAEFGQIIEARRDQVAKARARAGLSK
ncbi:mechanosensitive ion channel family protein [Microbacterium sp. AK031]|uniref:mechanosensitive ion channel family protein n=1 Tax=Microbacterium sp. AK031 TaxID=2723076 RepID=UPI0021691B4A|nr:mechanosensitive ion channel family protein [Microbacterium sp. AK031]MCS3844958.1 small-conductance mechanosensitive channel [Microbacterium sp. AK031]